MKKIILIISTLIIGLNSLMAQQYDLNYFIRQAETNSPLIQKSNNAKKLFELDYQQIDRVLRSPEINLESNILFAPIISHDNNTNRFELTSPGATNYTGYDQANTDGGQFQAFVSIKQSLFTNGNLKKYADKTNILKNKNENSTQLTKHEIEQLVGYQYVVCAKSKIQVANSDSVIQLLSEQLNLMKKLVENGIYKQTDLMLLEIEYQNIVIENKTLTNDYKNNIYDLKLLCGINNNTIEDIQIPDLKMNITVQSESPFLASYKLDSMAVIADQSISELKYKPQLNLFANAGLNAVYIPTFNRLGFSAGLNFSWNLFDGGQRKLEAERSKVNLNNLQIEKDYFLSQKEINLNKIKSQMNSLENNISLINNQLEQYNKLYNAYQLELSHGQISIMDFKNLLKDISAKKQEMVLLKMEKQLLINSFNYWNY